jgi:cell pole-organizing protein PopZ
MEEILASIRRIIADDDGGKAADAEIAVAAPPKPAPSAAAAPLPPEPAAASDTEIDTMLAGFEGQDAAGESAEGSGDVLELTEAMEVPPPQPASFRTIEPNADVVFAEPPRERATAPPPPPPALEEAPSGLMSDNATAAVTSAFSSLAHTVLLQNARTLDDLVREMLRPMLKTWLDENLPTIVERLVRAEIERVSRGRG